jgi:hypothetical protein
MLEIENDFTSTNKYYLLAIENTNYNDLYKNDNESYKTVGKCILDEVIIRTAYNLNSKIIDHKNLRFNAQFLLKKYGNHYSKALDVITSKILFRTTYVVGEHSRSYYLNDVNLKKKVVVTSFNLDTKGKNVVIKLKKIRSNKDNQLKFLNKFFDPRKLKIDIDSIYKKLKNELEFNPEKAKNIIRLNNALQFHQGVYIFKYDKLKTQRLYSSFTMLKKEDRKLVTYEGKKLMEIDIKNSIPTLFSLLLTNSLNIDYNILFNSNKNLYKYILMFLERVKSIDLVEVQEFQRLCLAGVIYEKVNLKYERRIFNRISYENDFSADESDYNVDTKNKTKIDFISMLFSKEDTYLDMEIEVEGKFPSIANFLYEIKNEDYKYLSHILFSIESEIMINLVARKFNNLNRGRVPLFTIHDCICTNEDNSSRLHDFMKEVLKSVTGYDIKLTVD